MFNIYSLKATKKNCTSNYISFQFNIFIPAITGKNIYILNSETYNVLLDPRSVERRVL